MEHASNTKTTAPQTHIRIDPQASATTENKTGLDISLKIAAIEMVDRLGELSDMCGFLSCVIAGDEPLELSASSRQGMAAVLEVLAGKTNSERQQLANALSQ